MDFQQQKSYNVLLIGDNCEDVYHYGMCERISPEAPVPVFKEYSQKTKVGMSSNVRLNLESFGIIVDHYTSREITKKHRFIDQRYNQHILRWDEGEKELVREMDIGAPSPRILEKYDAVVISDYNKGFLRYNTCKRLTTLFAKHKIPVFVDTKKKDLTCFVDSIIKINEKEYANIEKHLDNPQFVVTLGERGAVYRGKNYTTTPKEVFDVCGAGDVFLSALVYGVLDSGSIEKSIDLANKAATLSVSKAQTYVLSDKDIKEIKK